MDHCRKMTIVPHEAQQGGSLDVKKTRPFRRFGAIAQVVLKLALVDGYDKDGQLKDSAGKPLQGSSISDLLEHAFKSGKFLVGEKEFVDLLHKAQVEPALIVNENLRTKLLEKFNTNPISLEKERDKEKQPTTTRILETPMPNTPETPEKSPEKSSPKRTRLWHSTRKRALEPDDDEPTIPLKRLHGDWEIPK